MSPGGLVQPAFEPKIEIENLRVSYGSEPPALDGVTLTVPARQITVVFGPAGGGKSTLLRTINRLNDLVETARTEGRVRLDGEDILGPDVDITRLRRRIGIVFALPVPLPMSIRRNLWYGLELAGERNRRILDEAMEKALSAAALWDEVKDRLDDHALDLSGGQQQRLCIARALAVEPEVILFDEPCSAIDPIATAKIEDLIQELKKLYTVVIVTHNMQQAARVSDFTAFMMLGELVEFDRTEKVFTNPANKLTEDYITGRFG
ncbi:MAG: phosphate transporter ATP-binding protein [Candidatus Aminicenantes bacterium]|nr:phosphate transporter ATP-binding protein [Candidatus Aminicenantes bacterium]